MADISGSLFTNEYRDRHIAGKSAKKGIQKGVGSCFDATDTVNVGRPALHAHNVSPGKSKEPQWSQATGTFLARTKKEEPTDFLKGHEGQAATARKAVARPADKGPPKAGAWVQRPNPPNSEFRRFYERSDLPIVLSHSSRKSALHWKVDINTLDYHHYLPIFFDGIRETTDPLRFMAIRGVEDLLAAGGSKILPVIPQLIMPIKTALNTRDPEVIGVAMRLLQKLVEAHELVGEALVPYYRQLLPVFNLCMGSNKNLGDAIDYGQNHTPCLGELAASTLDMFELHGGPSAWLNIKYMVPTYESAVNPA